MPARTNWRICASSSTTSTCCSPSVMSLLIILLHRQRQANRDRHALVHAFAGRLNGSVVGGHKSAGDPESQSEARSHLGVAIPTEEFLSKQSAVVGVKTGPLVDDRNHELS